MKTESIIHKLTYDNWEALAGQVARELFPEGTLVEWAYVHAEFGLVRSVSESGKITIQRGALPVEKITDNEGTGGTYAKYWYRADINGFKPYTKEDLSNSRQVPRTRFSPRCFYGPDWKTRKYEFPIEWYQVRGNRGLILAKPKINKDGLIVYESYSD
jgi:hypothetical protein